MRVCACVSERATYATRGTQHIMNLNFILRSRCRRSMKICTCTSEFPAYLSCQFEIVHGEVYLHMHTGGHVDYHTVVRRVVPAYMKVCAQS